MFLVAVHVLFISVRRLLKHLFQFAHRVRKLSESASPSGRGAVPKLTLLDDLSPAARDARAERGSEGTNPQLLQKASWPESFSRVSSRTLCNSLLRRAH